MLCAACGAIQSKLKVRQHQPTAPQTHQLFRGSHQAPPRGKIVGLLPRCRPAVLYLRLRRVGICCVVQLWPCRGVGKGVCLTGHRALSAERSKKSSNAPKQRRPHPPTPNAHLLPLLPAPLRSCVPPSSPSLFAGAAARWEAASECYEAQLGLRRDHQGAQRACT